MQAELKFKVQVNVLTLSRNTERQEQIRKHWEGWDLKFHQGYDYRDLNYPEEYRRQFALTCCWCGHHKIWNEINGIPGWHMIIEDDAVPAPGIKQAINFIHRKNHDYQVVKLFHLVEPTTFEIGENGHKKQQLIPLSEDPISTTAYLIRNTKRLMKSAYFRGSPDLTLHEFTKVGGIWPLVANCAGESIIGP